MAVKATHVVSACQHVLQAQIYSARGMAMRGPTEVRRVLEGYHGLQETGLAGINSWKRLNGINQQACTALTLAHNTAHKQRLKGGVGSVQGEEGKGSGVCNRIRHSESAKDMPTE